MLKDKDVPYDGCDKTAAAPKDKCRLSHIDDEERIAIEYKKAYCEQRSTSSECEMLDNRIDISLEQVGTYVTDKFITMRTIYSVKFRFRYLHTSKMVHTTRIIKYHKI